MLKPTIKYEQEINIKLHELLLDNERNQHYFVGNTILPSVINTEYGATNWAILNFKEELIGYISTYMQHDTTTVSHLALVSFNDDISSKIHIGRAVVQVIDILFRTQKALSLRFIVYEGNPAVRGYKKLTERAGGLWVLLPNTRGEGKHNIMFYLDSLSYFKNIKK